MKFCATVSLLALALVASPVLADSTPPRQQGHWAQDYTGRKADGAIVFGTLPNGLRYAIMHNQTPSDGVAMRMRIGSGSIVERDEEQGLAHFLEHMAFRGSKNIADGDVVHMLERQGLRFGPDTNAFTAQDETVYMFTFPKADASALDTGFTLFREIGERLTLAPAAIEAEKGVILSEERLRDVPSYRSIKANLDNAMAGTRAVTRWPIGLVDTIKGATSERMRRYYAANYRPDNATLVVVGNIDPARVEAQIKARFADWKPQAKPDDVAFGTPAPVAPSKEFVENGAPDRLTLSWVRPADLRAETEAVDREWVLRTIGLTVLNNRLADRAAKPGSPFVSGNAGAARQVLGSAGLTQINITAAPGSWREALAAVTQEQRQLLQGGVDAQELKRAVTEMLTRYQTAAAQASTRQNGDLADELVQSVNSDEIATSPAQDLAFAQPILAAATPQQVNAALQLAFAGQGPVLFRSAQSGPVTAPVLADALKADYARPLAAREAQKAIVWPYDNFGAPGAILSQTVDKELGTTTVTFANGSRLMVKPTAFEKDKISVSVALGQGRKGADPALAHALWAVDLVRMGGTGKLSAGDLARWAESEGKVMSVGVSAGTGAFTLSGATRPRDLLSQMQLLSAYARDPGFRPELAEKLAAVVPMYRGQLDASAGGVFMREVGRVTAGGDGRYGQLPTTADLEATRASELPLLLRGALAGPADVVIVGDVNVAEAIKATQATFGAGPAAPRQPEVKVHVAMAAGNAQPDVVIHSGRADQAYYGEFWKLPDYFEAPADSHTADVVSAILSARLVDTVREKLGMTYSPSTQAVSSVVLPGMGYLGVMLETPPANFDAFRALLAGQIADLAARPVGADELDRARRPLVQARTKQFENNDFWIGQLPLVLRDPRVKTPVLEEAKGLAAVSAADVQAFVKRYVEGKAPVTIIAKAK